jgi:hypothetical protein
VAVCGYVEANKIIKNGAVTVSNEPSTLKLGGGSLLGVQQGTVSLLICDRVGVLYTVQYKPQYNSVST